MPTGSPDELPKSEVGHEPDFGGCGLVAGLAMGAMAGISVEFPTVLVVGLAGGLSTFSSFAGQTVDYFRRGRIAQGLSNIALNMVFVCTAVTLGLWLAGILLK
ncbi:MAG: hypothetical protein RL096_312 [Actinomycetota bacterium]